MVTSIVFLGWSYDLNAADGMFSFFLVLEFWNLDKCNVEEPWSNATTFNNFTRVHDHSFMKSRGGRLRDWFWVRTDV